MHIPALATVMKSAVCLVLLSSLVAGGCASSSAVPAQRLAQVQEPVATPAAAQPNVSEEEEEDSSAPLRYTVRKQVNEGVAAAPAIPPVLLTVGHAGLCRVRVGEQLPNFSLPKLGGPQTELASLLGKQATVVLFWHPDRWMARTALLDMQRDIAANFQADQVSVVGIAVREAQGSVQAALNNAQAAFPQLLDTDGRAFAQVGSTLLPRIYVLDPQGKIAWFDVEYSEATRRELAQTLDALTAG